MVLQYPAGATINGITVSINRSSSGTTAPLIRDNVVSLVKAGTIVGNNLAVTGTDWPNTAATVNYGGISNLWGTTWTPADINNAVFGVVFQPINSNTTLARTATVDFIEISSDLFYSLPCNSECKSYYNLRNKPFRLM